MENDICVAYTFIEFGGDFWRYYNTSDRYEDSSEHAARSRWAEIKTTYKQMSKYMSDDAIIQAQSVVMGLY